MYTQKKLTQNCKLVMARLLVIQFKSFQSPKVDIKLLSKQLNFDNLNSYNLFLSKWDLSLNEYVIHDYDDIQQTRQELNNIYKNYLLKEQQLIYSDKLKSLEILQKFLSHDLLYASPVGLLQIINQINNLLFKYYRHYIKIKEQTEISCQAVEKSFILLCSANTNSSGTGKSIDKKQSLKNCLKLLFKFQLENYVCCSRLNVIILLIQQCQKYHEIVQRSLLILEELEKSLNDQIEENIIGTPMYTEITYQNIIYFREIIESHLESSINLIGLNLQYKSEIEKLLLNIIGCHTSSFLLNSSI